MSTFERYKVVMLPTNEKAKVGEYLVINKEGKLCVWNTDKFGVQNTLPIQHLYFLSDEEIKEGDWYYHFKLKEIFRLYKDTMHNKAFELEYAKKIIATTDGSLGHEESIYDPRSKTGGRWITLPQPSAPFIEKFVEEYNKGNVITDGGVMILQVKLSTK